MLMEGPVTDTIAAGPGAIGRSNTSVSGAGPVPSTGPDVAAPGLPDRPRDASATRLARKIIVDSKTPSVKPDHCIRQDDDPEEYVSVAISKQRYALYLTQHMVLSQRTAPLLPDRPSHINATVMVDTAVALLRAFQSEHGKGFDTRRG